MVFASAKTIFSSGWLVGREAWWEVLAPVGRGEECRGSCRSAERLITTLKVKQVPKTIDDYRVYPTLFC
jgi:hypothetical protein